MDRIVQESARYQALKARLCALHEDLDEDTLADTLEGLSELDDILAAALRSALEDEAMGEALKGRIESMRTRHDRLLSRAKAKRAACARAMHECGLRRVIRDDLTASLRAGTRRLDIRDEACIPRQFWRTPDPVLDRRALGEALRGGQIVEGADLVTGEPGITVRTK